SLMVVWGGDGPSVVSDTGGRYDPATDTWTPTSTPNPPSPRFLHTAVWTGSLMIVWGGSDLFFPRPHNTGSRYDPATDSMSSTSLTNAPTDRAGHTAIWTGGLMVGWGGGDTVAVGTTPAPDARTPGARTHPPTATDPPAATAHD